MAKGAWIGVSSKARKIKKMWIGVGGKARKVKKVWIGVGGKARLCWAGGELEYYGTASALSVARYNFTATSIGNYALFAGGYAGGAVKSTVDAYNTSLTRSAPTALRKASQANASTSNGTYAFISSGTTATTMTAYNTSLTQGSPLALPSSYKRSTATSMREYALFVGTNSTVTSYNASLSKSTLNSSLCSRTNYPTSTSVGNCAIFAGSPYTTAYNDSLTGTQLGYLPCNGYAIAETVANKYGLFVEFNSATKSIDTSLTISDATKISGEKLSNAASASVGEYALFGGGYYNDDSGNGQCVATVTSYNASLTQAVATSLSKKRSGLAATSVGDYALFGGGNYIYSPGNSASTVTTESIVDVYQAG